MNANEFIPNDDVSSCDFREVPLNPLVALPLLREDPNKSFLGVVEFHATDAFLDEYMSLMSKGEEYAQVTELDVT